MGTDASVQFVKTAGVSRIGDYWRSDAPASLIREWMQSMRIDGFQKVASIGGATEEGFEQAFSSLAYAYLKDKAPRLLDFMVGFQLVDRNEDNTKAMGLFGFLVGDQWLYAPVFFLNGDLKGHELLYIKKQDSFVPMKENWVNYLMSRKPHILGEPSSQDTYELGGLQPDIQSMSVSPSVGIGKRGCDDWAKPALPLIAALATKQASALFDAAPAGVKLAMDGVVASPLSAALSETAETFDLNKVLPRHYGLLKRAYDLSQRFPGVKQGFDKLYGPDCFSRWGRELYGHTQRAGDSLIPETVKQAADRPTFTGDSLIPDTPQPEHPVKSGALRVYVREEYTISEIGADDLDETGEDQLTADEKSEVLQHGYLVKDERKGEEKSVAYRTELAQKLQNPHETGLYSVLEKPGDFDRMLVISNPHSNSGRQNFCTVVRVGDSGSKAWLNIHRNNLWADKVELREDYDDWFDGLGGPDSLRKDGIYLAIDEAGSATTPFHVREVYGEGSYKVDFLDHCKWDDRRGDAMPSISADNSDDVYVSSYGAKLIVDAEGKRGTKLRAIQGELRVPGTFKFFKLKDPPKPKKRTGPNSIMPESDWVSTEGSQDKPINPGKIEDLQLLFTEKTARLKLYDDHNEVEVSGVTGTKRFTKLAGFLHLVADHGFDEEQAREMLKTAATKQSAVFRVSYAPGFGDKAHLVKSAFAPNESVLAGGPMAPHMPPQEYGVEMLGGRNAARAGYPLEEHHLVDQLDSSMLDPGVHDIWQNYTHEDFQDSMGVAQEAAQSGQKEVFDTAMISGMLKSVRQDSLVDRYLGDLMKALDKLGRILFMFYWHQEEFEDRYGKADLPELEDSLRNAFETLGEVALFLKEKTIEPAFGGMGEPDLEESARN